ncbi:MAG: hypothetical protein AB1540_11835 [Bdellovibrionota bacterium]
MAKTTLAFISVLGFVFLGAADQKLAKKPSHQVHVQHEHVHGEKCGHTAKTHDDHVDYLHDGHRHRVHADKETGRHVDECNEPQA